MGNGSLCRKCLIPKTKGNEEKETDSSQNLENLISSDQIDQLIVEIRRSNDSKEKSNKWGELLNYILFLLGMLALIISLSDLNIHANTLILDPTNNTLMVNPYAILNWNITYIATMAVFLLMIFVILSAYSKEISKKSIEKPIEVSIVISSFIMIITLIITGVLSFISGSGYIQMLSMFGSIAVFFFTFIITRAILLKKQQKINSK